MSLSLSSFKFLQVNINHSLTGYYDAINFAQQEKIDILFIQDPYISPPSLSSFCPSFPFFSSNSNSALTIVLNSSLPVRLYHSTHNSVTVELTLSPSPFFFSNFYLSPHGDILEQITEIEKNNLFLNNLICVGDFNCPSRLWGYTFENLRGRSFMDFLTQYNFHLINNRSLGPSYQHNNRLGNPDLTFCSASSVPFISNWTIHSHLILSDHFPISFILSSPSSHSTSYIYKTKYGLNKFLQNFKRHVPRLDHLASSLLSTSDLDSYIDNLITSAQDSAFRSLKKKPNYSSKPINWWTPHLKSCRNKLTALYKRIQKARLRNAPIDEIQQYQINYKKRQSNL